MDDKAEQYTYHNAVWLVSVYNNVSSALAATAPTNAYFAKTRTGCSFFRSSLRIEIGNGQLQDGGKTDPEKIRNIDVGNPTETAQAVYADECPDERTKNK